MTKRLGLYVICGTAAFFAFGAAHYGLENKESLERLVKREQPAFQTRDVLGNNSYEKFYVIDEDTAYVLIDGHQVRNYVYLRDIN